MLISVPAGPPQVVGPEYENRIERGGTTLASPKAKELENALHFKFKDDTTKVCPFNMPMKELRVGNIDSLIFLSDALKKTTTSVETTVRKVALQWIELDEVPAGEKGDKEKKEEEKKKKKTKFTTIADISPEDNLTHFAWSVARYPYKKTLPELVNTIKLTVIQAEKELRDRQLEYNTICQKISSLTANESGNLLTRDINSVIKGYNKRMESEASEGQLFKPVEERVTKESKDLMSELQYAPALTTLYVVVPKNEQKNWERSYFNLFDAKNTPDKFIVPNSSIKLEEDNDSVMNSVVIFTKDIEDFKNICRGKRFTVRKNDPTITINEKEKEKLLEAQKQTKANVKRWAKTTFQNVFDAWLHLKCIQCFVESILRYGLPADFEAILVLPKKGSEKKLIKNLCKNYEYLAGGFNDREDEQIAGAPEEKTMVVEKYFPFVHLDINLSLSS